jgi:hypothetical protein
MSTVRNLCACLALLTAPAFALWLGWRLDRRDGLLDRAEDLLTATAATVETAGDSVRQLPGIADARLGDVSQALDGAVRMANGQLTGARSDIRDVGNKLDGPLLAVSASVAHLSGVRDDLVPVLAEAQRTAANLALTTRDLRPQVLGLVAASKIAAGEVAQTMREIQRAAPSAIASFQGIQGSVQRTAETISLGIPQFIENSNGIAANVNQITKPRWYDRLIKATIAGAAVGAAVH